MTRQIGSDVVTQIESLAKLIKNTGMSAHDAFLMGWSLSKNQAVTCLKTQYKGCKALVSYDIAAEVLKTDMDEYERSGATNAQIFVDRINT